MRFSYILSALLIALAFTIGNVGTSHAQAKTKVVKVKKQSNEVIKDGDQHFDVGIKGSGKKIKQTSKGRRYVTSKNVEKSIRANKKGKKGPNTGGSLSEGTRKMNKKLAAQRKEIKKSAKESRKRRKNTIKRNQKIPG